MALRDLTDRSAVLQAINEFRELGEDRVSREVRVRALATDSKLHTRARRFHPRQSSAPRTPFSFLTVGPLTPAEFSGGRDDGRQGASTWGSRSSRPMLRTISRLGCAGSWSSSPRHGRRGSVTLTRLSTRFAAARRSSRSCFPSHSLEQRSNRRLAKATGPAFRGSPRWIRARPNTTRHGVYPVLLFQRGPDCS